MDRVLCRVLKLPLLWLSLGLGACTSLPVDYPRQESHALTDTGDTRLARALAPLHAKTLVADRRTLVVGSMNLDPRSLFLNTEIGVILEMPKMANAFVQRLETDLRRTAYRLALAPEDAAGSGRRVEWIALEDGGEVRYTSDPGAGFWRRLGAGLLSLLPIESQL